MAKKRKKPGKVINMPLSSENYIRTRARKLPMHECLITDLWKEAGIATIIISRQHTNRHITFGLYLVDLYCLGVKDTLYKFNIMRSEYDQLMDELSLQENLEPCDYVLAHNIIYGALEFADEYGLSPHKDFTKITQYILEEDDEKVELVDIDFGRDGKPCLVAEIGKVPANVISQLEKTAGKGNYEIIYIDGEGLEIDDIYDEDDFEEDDFDEDEFVNDMDKKDPGKQLKLFEDDLEEKKTSHKKKDTQHEKKDILPNGKDAPQDDDEMEEWRKLYELMMQIKELQPWTWMFEYDIFAIKDPETGNTGFVSVMGELGEHISVVTYMGEEGIHGFWRLQDAAPDISHEMFMQIPQLQASFEDRQMLLPKDLKLIKQLGLKFRGKSSWPMFRSFHPGYFPWFLKPWERKFMVHILEQTIVMSQRTKEDPELLRNEDKYELLIRIPVSENEEIIWKDSVIRVPGEVSTKVTYSINHDDLEIIRDYPVGNMILELDLFMMPDAVEEGGIDPYFGYMLIMVDQRSSLIINHKILSPVPSLMEMYTTIPQHVVDMIINYDKRPKEVWVQNGLLAELLESVMVSLNINLRMIKRLKVLEGVRKEMMNYFGS